MIGDKSTKRGHEIRSELIRAQRERVVALDASGMSNKEIAARMGISLPSVANYLRQPRRHRRPIPYEGQDLINDCMRALGITGRPDDELA